MHCFNHHESVAVCSCGTCFKGLCQNCMQSCADKFVCSQICAERLQKITKMNDIAISIYGVDKNVKWQKPGLQSVIFDLAFAAVLLGYGIYSVLHYEEWSMFYYMMPMSLVFISKGLWTYTKGLRV